MKLLSKSGILAPGEAPELQHEITLFSHLLEYNTAAVAMFDTSMHYILVSHRWLTDYGLQGIEVIGKSHYDLFPDLSQEWRQVHQRCLLGNIEKKEEDRFVRADGTVQWLHWEVRPWYNNDASIGGLLIFAEDISQRKNAEIAISESEEKYRTLVERISDGFIALDTDWNFTYINKVAEKLFSQKAANLLGKNIWDVFPLSVNGPFYKAYHEAAATQKNIYIEGFSISVGVHVYVSIYPSKTGLSVYFRDITDQKNAQDNLLQSEEKFRALVERISDGFIALDNKMNFVFANPMAEKLFGHSTEYFAGKNIWEVYPNAIGGPFYKSYLRAMETQRHVQFINFSTYAKRWLETNVYPSESGLTIYFKDVTERVDAEHAARASEETRRLIMGASLDAIVCMDMNGSVTYWNTQAEHLFGWKKDAVIGMRMEDSIIPEQYRERHKLGFERYKATGKGTIINKMVELKALHKNGNEFPIELFIVEVGNVAEPFFCAFIRDITDRKKKERELLQTNARLNLAQSIAHIGSAVMDTTTNIAAWSDEACKIYGIDPSQNLVLFDEWLTYIHPDDLDYAKETMEKALKDKQPVTFYHRIIRPDGEVRFVLSSCREEYDESSNAMSLYGVVHDITEIKNLQQELLEQQQQEQMRITSAIIDAEEKERNAIGEELHDNVNQILTGILLQLSRVKGNPQRTEEIIELSMQYLQKAISENRKISKELIIPDFSSSPFSQQLRELATYMFSGVDIAIQLDTADFDEALLGNKQKLVVYRILQEQCTNIIKYAKATSVKILLCINDAAFKMQVTDNGTGMDIQKTSKGIGLRNIKSRLSSLNGYVNIITSPGRGFTLEAGFPV